MKSLVHLSSSTIQLPPPVTLVQICLNPDSGTVYGASIDGQTNSISVWAIDFEGRHQSNFHRLVSRLCVDQEDDLSSEQPLSVVSLKVISEFMQLCLVTSDGRISVCPLIEEPNDETLNPEEFGVVGQFHERISAAAWSPDDEILVVITGVGSIILFTKSFDLLLEVPIDYKRFGDDQPVSLGWGTKSTQFHGSLGKSAALAGDFTEPSEVSPAPDTMSPLYQISWRGDGAFFAISCPDSNASVIGSSRSIKVYSRDGLLSSSSERVPNSRLGDAMAWRPEGSIIASSVQDMIGNRLNVMFFERNGLQRYGFNLLDAHRAERIWGMSWNSDSRVLAVGLTKPGLQDGDNENQSHTHSVQLWTRNNYHWYLKHEIQSDLQPVSKMEGVPSMLWHPENPHLIYFIGTGGSVERRQLSWENLADQTLKPYDTGSVAVIDGFQVLLTNFRYQTVPPPMSSTQLNVLIEDGGNLPRIPAHVSFSLQSGLVAVAFPHAQIICYLRDISKDGHKLSDPIELGRFVLELDTSHTLCRQICVSDMSRKKDGSEFLLLALFSDIKLGGRARDGIYIQKICIGGSGDTHFNTPTVFYAQGLEKWCKVIASHFEGQFFIQSSDGRIEEVRYTPHLAPTFTVSSFWARFPLFCPTFLSFASPQLSLEFLDSVILFGLSETGKLYLNQHLVAGDCSSFTVDNNDLMYTTFSHQLKFVPLTIKLVEKLRARAESSEISTLLKSSPGTTRAVERGSVIVACSPSAMKIILQMPRGNLETIYPRPMVLRWICLNLLGEGRWAEAFLQCRKHKIEFNILVDFDRTRFLMEGVERLVTGLENNDHLSLFISSLTSVDVTEELYPITKSWNAGRPIDCDINESLSGEAKINTVCQLMIDELTKKQVKWGYINSILTAMVSKKPSDYKSALGLLSELKIEDSEKVEDAIKYIIFLSDVNELYKVALSMYDLTLVILVAQHSQKDPKEYLPFLQSLKEFDIDRRKFKIDDYLGRYSTALTHLVTSPDATTSEVLNYVVLHSLYVEALELFIDDFEKSKSVRALQGDWLMTQGKTMEAGLVYMLAGEIHKAVEGFQQAEAWEQMFSIILQHPNNIDIHSNAQEMAERLSSSGRFLDCAVVLLDYANDLDGAIGALCEGQSFSEAIRKTLSASRADLITDTIIPSIEANTQSFLDELELLKEQLLKQVERLSILKKTRETNPNQFFLQPINKEESGDTLEGADAMTEATTIFRTDYSRYTRGFSGRSAGSAISTRSGRSAAHSSKLRKKEAKKKASGKKGSVYEEEYLLSTIIKLATETLPSLQNSAGRLLPALVQLISLDRPSARRLLSLAKGVQSTLTELQSLIVSKVKVVWDEREEEGRGGGEDDGWKRLEAFEAYFRNLAKFCRPSVQDVSSWRLSILD
ncbi:IKI3 family-domain-containing protein [Phakopsora pachyrhizi]|uniref:Elongator complex protein 1 n=1 Tax=Phakopsora pachyrhizi TaxID=170000 RepID=A0AAV0BHB0_PHAPC|nr:IKI3 family-domain-containing protein [Phakopsora pachyrhizi]CAH7686311.1 IKI3 family-domain-containing protein [Phakopsora pachyrhizi]